MKKVEILEYNQKFGACNEKGKSIIPTIYDSIEVCSGFIKTKMFGLYLLFSDNGNLLFKDMFKEIFIYSSYIAFEQHEDEWVIYTRSLECINLEKYEDIHCDEKYLAVKENGCWKVLDEK